MENIKEKLIGAIELEKFVIQRAKQLLVIKLEDEDYCDPDCYDESDFYVDSTDFTLGSVDVYLVERSNSDYPDKFRIEVSLFELLLTDEEWNKHLESLILEKKEQKQKRLEEKSKKEKSELEDKLRKMAKELNYEVKKVE